MAVVINASPFNAKAKTILPVASPEAIPILAPKVTLNLALHCPLVIPLNVTNPEPLRYKIQGTELGTVISVKITLPLAATVY